MNKSEHLNKDTPNHWQKSRKEFVAPTPREDHIMSELLSFYLYRAHESSRVVEQNQQYIKRSINLYPPVFSANLEAVSLVYYFV
jgi:hypothetical protein